MSKKSSTVKPAKRGMRATPKIEKQLAQWKATYIAAKQAEQNVDLARSIVNGTFDANAVDFIVSKLGTIARQNRAPKIVTDWEALARKFIPASVIDEHLEAFTASSGGGPVLAAPSSWTVEAGC